jgi:hypothetical protein
MRWGRTAWHDDELIVSSEHFLSDQFPILAVYGYSKGSYVFLTHHECESDEPLFVHFSCAADVDESLRTAPRVRRAISLRVELPNGELSNWVTYRWMSDRKIDRWKTSGRLDEEYEKLLVSLM